MFALTAHVTSSVGSFGAVAAFLALAIAGLTSQDAQLVRAAYITMAVTAWYVILPLVLASLATGLVSSLGTPWGLFRHYWVLVKLLLTVFVAIVLLLQLEPIGYMARVAAETSMANADLLSLRRSLVTHASGGLLVLLVTTTLGMYKPRGMTRYGARKQHTVDGWPAFAVALVRASTVVLLSSKLTTASAFSRSTSTFVMPFTFVNGLFTEITHDTHVIPDTESVTVLVSARACEEARAIASSSAPRNSFMWWLFSRATGRGTALS